MDESNYLDDLGLLARWRETRDARAFRELTVRHGAMVFGTCHRILRNASDAEDLAQECFIHLCQTNAAISVSLPGWLHTHATRRCLDYLKSRSRRGVREREYRQTYSVEDAHEWSDIQQIVDECISELPETLRDIVVSFFLEQCTQSEIAKQLDVSQSTVSRRIDEGVSLLRKGLKNRGCITSAAFLSGALSSSFADAVPATLSASLGRLALSGTSKHASVGVAARVAGGAMLMKKLAVGIGVALVLLGTLWIKYEPDSGSPPDQNGARPLPIAIVSQQVDHASYGVSDGESTVASPRVEEAPLLRAEASGSIRGRVVWKLTGSPVFGRMVQLSDSSSVIEMETTTDGLGEFLFDALPTGLYDLNVARERVRPTRAPVGVLLAEDEHRDGIVISISNGGVVQGLVSVGGVPAPDMDFELVQLGTGMSHGEIDLVTDGEGRFSVSEILEGERTFQGQLKLDQGAMLWSDSVRAVVQPDEITNVDFDFASGRGSMKGLVTINGEPAPHQPISIIFYERTGRKHLVIVFLKSDSEGRYELANVVEGRVVVHTSLRLENGRNVYGDPENVLIGTDRAVIVDFAFKRGTGILEGRITRRGRPVSDGSIIVAGEIVGTDEGGYYRVDGVPEGPVTIAPELLIDGGKITGVPGVALTIRANSRTRADFDFPGGLAAIEGFLLTDDDQPVRGTVVISYAGRTGAPQVFFANSRQDGYFHLERIPAGQADLFFMLPNNEPMPEYGVTALLTAGVVVQEDLHIPANLLPEEITVEP